MKYTILKTEASRDYELIDSGDGEKLERFGSLVLRRPDPQALWKRSLDNSHWDRADYFFNQPYGDKGRWVTNKKELIDTWHANISNINFKLKLSTFKHIGVFPEQQPNWSWIQEKIQLANRPIEVLNLFGYTGGATLAAASAGARVCHLDGSRTTIQLARENAELSHLQDKPIRWILDDARSFVRKEIKRGVRYDGIIMDPPAFGHGPNRELWKIENDFLPLLDLCKEVLSEEPLFFLVNGYASQYSAIAYHNNLKKMFSYGTIESGELVIADQSNNMLPAGIFSRWSSL